MRTSLVAAVLCAFACANPPPDTTRWQQMTPNQGWPDEAGAAIPLSFELESLTWLSNVSRYGHAGPPTDRAHSGSFGVGNGRVFALIGLDEPRNTITGAMGPGYQSHGGFFGDSGVVLLRDGAPVIPTEEQAQRPRGTAIVRTLATVEDLTWMTTDVAPPGVDLIARHITVHVRNPVPEPLTLRITLARAANEQVPPSTDALLQARGPKLLKIDCGGGTATETTLDVPVPTLRAEGEWSTTCFYRFSTDGNWPSTNKTITELLEESRTETTNFLHHAATLNVPDQKVADLYEGMLVTMHVQSAESGVVSPMSRYTYGWLRDEEGPVRLYLAAGLHEQARTLLEAGYHATIQRHSISNSFPLDIDTQVAEPADPEAFWASADFMPGYAPAEAPSFVPLLTARYVDHTGDRTILTPSRLSFLTACLTRQELNADGLLPFSRDETFRYPYATVLGSSPEAIGWSANSSFLLAAAAEKLVTLGGPSSLNDLAHRVRAATEEHYWSDARGSYAPILRSDDASPIEAPFEDVSTQPLWVGYLDASDPKATQNLDGTLSALLREDGTLLSPTAAFYTGMVPGFLLQNVTALGRPREEERAFNALDLVASPSGHFEELHAPDNSVAMVVHRADGTGGDAPARYRPWEGGDTTWAMLDYLLGARPRATEHQLTVEPHLPNRWSSVGATGLKMGEESYDLNAREFYEGRLIELHRNGGTDDWKVSFVIHGLRTVEAAWVDGRAVKITSGGRPALPEVVVKPGQSVRVIAQYAPSAGKG